MAKTETILYIQKGVSYSGDDLHWEDVMLGHPDFVVKTFLHMEKLKQQEPGLYRVVKRVDTVLEAAE